MIKPSNEDRIIRQSYGQTNALIRRADEMNKADNVRFWHKADMAFCTAHVRFWGRADMPVCTANVRF